MEIQLITMDMDGTTFQDDHVTIPPRNITALRAAAERGIAVAITTGRAWSQVQEAAEQLGCISWAVTANGASALDLTQGEWLWHTGIPAEQRRAMTTLLLERGLPFEVYAQGDSYIQQERAEQVIASSPSPEYGEVLRRRCRFVADLNAALEERPTEKIHIFSVPAGQRAALVEELRTLGPVDVDSAFGANMELIAPGVNKAAAVAELCRRLNLGPEQVMAFGDAGNDEALLRWAGWSFAVANASEGAKGAAKYLTASNEAGGVGLAVERYVLGRA